MTRTYYRLRKEVFKIRSINKMGKEVELLIRKNALKDVELWLYQQYLEIEKELVALTEDRNDDSAKSEVEIDG